MAENESGPQQERHPYYDEPWLKKEAHGDEHLLDLIVQRELLGDEFAQKGGAAQLSDEDREIVLKLNQSIKELKDNLGIDPYQE